MTLARFCFFPMILCLVGIQNGCFSADGNRNIEGNGSPMDPFENTEQNYKEAVSKGGGTSKSTASLGKNVVGLIFDKISNRDLLEFRKVNKENEEAVHIYLDSLVSGVGVYLKDGNLKELKEKNVLRFQSTAVNLPDKVSEKWSRFEKQMCQLETVIIDCQEGLEPLRMAFFPLFTSLRLENMDAAGLEEFVSFVNEGNLPNLISLDLSSNEINNSEKIIELIKSGKLSRLVSLNLGGNKLSGEAFGKLMPLIGGKYLPNLTSLDLSDNKLDTANILLLCDYIKARNIPNLTSLSLSRNTLDQDGMNALVNLGRHLDSLTSLDLSGVGQDAVFLFPAIQQGHLKNLTSLDLGFNEIDMMQELIENIKFGNLKKLTFLNLRWNNISVEHIDMLADVIRGGYLPALVSLNLNNFFDRENEDRRGIHDPILKKIEAFKKNFPHIKVTP